MRAMAKRSYAHGTPEQMLAAFESKLQELGGDVSACSSVQASESIDREALMNQVDALAEQFVQENGLEGVTALVSLSGNREVSIELAGGEEYLPELENYISNNLQSAGTAVRLHGDLVKVTFRNDDQYREYQGGQPINSDSYVEVETNEEATSRFIHTLVGDVNAALEANSELDSWTWEEKEDDLVLTTIAGDSVNEYSIPKADLTLDWDRISEDVDYILNEVQSVGGSDLDEVISWLSEHDQAFEDATMYFNSDDLSNVSLEDLIGWISDHDALYSDFIDRFPSFSGDVSSATNVNSSEIIEGTKHWDDLACQLIDELNAVNIALDDKPAVLDELVNNFGYTEEEAKGLFIRINECNADLSQQAVTSSESSSDSMIPSPYDNYYEVQELSEEELDGMYQVGDEIDGYECHVVAYLIVKPEFEDSMPNDAVLVDDEEYPVVELAGGRIYPIEIPAEQYTFIKSKQVEDSDGFMTDYTMYYDTENDRYVFVFGDNEVYKPEDEDFDYECETEEQANEWFDSYDGFAEDDNEDPEDEFRHY